MNTNVSMANSGQCLNLIPNEDVAAICDEIIGPPAAPTAWLTRTPTETEVSKILMTLIGSSLGFHPKKAISLIAIALCNSGHMPEWMRS